jgi:hypothetical protein
MMDPTVYMAATYLFYLFSLEIQLETSTNARSVRMNGGALLEQAYH